MASSIFRVAFVDTHPIQYQAPWYRKLAAHPQLDIHVFFCHKAGPRDQAAAGFNVEFDWDISLLDGYPHTFLSNRSSQPGLTRFRGLDTPEIRGIIERERYDAVVVHGWHYKSAWQTILACWRARIPVMARSDSYLFTQRSALTRGFKWFLYRQFIPKLSACLAAGQRSREYFLHYGAQSNLIFLVPYLLDETLFSQQVSAWMPRRSELRRRWELAEAPTVFLFAGKFIQKKRPMDFIRAIDQAAGKGARIMGLMVGDGPLRSACESFVKERSVPIRFTGFLNQSEIVHSYIAADVLVLPSDIGETWGMVVNEAMACGRLCLVSDRVGCGPDLVLPGKTGEVFPTGDVGALARLLGSYSNRPDLVRQQGHQARKQVEEYSSSDGVNEILQALARIK